MKTKITLLATALFIMLGLTNCDPDPDPKLTINSNNLNFKVTNLTVGDGELTASGDMSFIETVNWTVTETVNGVTTTVSGSCKSDELPVRAGDEVEIRFTPSCPEQTEALFTLPDGTTHKATASSPSFKWTVPADFTPGMKIEGNTQYDIDDVRYKKRGAITLIELK